MLRASSTAATRGFSPTSRFHPWSIHRVDRGAGQIDLLLKHAREAGLTLASCSDVSRHLAAEPQLAHPAPRFAVAAST